MPPGQSKVELCAARRRDLARACRTGRWSASTRWAGAVQMALSLGVAETSGTVRASPFQAGSVQAGDRPHAAG